MIGTDDYPYRADAPDQPDKWQFSTRECTSFVAWRINNDLHVPFQNSYQGQWFGNAETWASAARAAGVRVDATPQVGSVAQFPPDAAGAGSEGHVAIVIGVTGATITVEDYNWTDAYDHDTTHNYSQHAVPWAGLNFLHFAGGGLTGGGLTGKVEASPVLNVRSGPDTTHPVVGSVPYGGVVAVSCWTKGASVTATWPDGSTWTTDVWDRLAGTFDGGPGYVSDAWINTGGDTSKQAKSC
ncbi:MAG: CHAP domain-containing protein [Streptosporangiaceae bacterium]|jgi:surface antigen